MAEIIDSRLNNLFKSTVVGELDRHILVYALAIAVFCCVRCSTDAAPVWNTLPKRDSLLPRAAGSLAVCSVMFV